MRPFCLLVLLSVCLSTLYRTRVCVAVSESVPVQLVGRLIGLPHPRSVSNGNIEHPTADNPDKRS